MYAAIRRWRVEPDLADELARRAGEEFVPMIANTDGFVAYYVVQAGPGVLVSFSVFGDERGIEESTSLSREWVRGCLGAPVTDMPDITVGQVVVHRTNQS